MSVAKRQKDDRVEKRKRRRRKSKPEVSWEEIDDDTIRGFVTLAEYFNGAIRFGRSRDSSVFGIGFYIGDDRFTEWISGGSEAIADMQNLIAEVYEDFKDDS